MHEELRCFSKEFNATGIQRLTQSCKKEKCADNDRDFVEIYPQPCEGYIHDIFKFHYN